MLGKGLESLIPPSQSDDDGGGEAKTPQGVSREPAGQSSPPRDSAAPSVPPHTPLHAEENTPFASAPPREGAVRRPQSEQAVFQIEIEKIKPNPHQPRRNFGEESIRELAVSIREFGIIQPLVVTKQEKETPVGLDVEYELIAGERRLLAAKMLGLERVPAIIRNIDEERERLEVAVIENVQREDLNPIERARAFARLQDEFRMTQREIAARLGKSRETVANTLRLLDLPSSIRETLERGEISESHGRLLLAVAEPAAQERLFRDLLLSRMTTRELKHRVREASAPRTEEKRETPPELKMLEEKLSAELGAPVTIEERGLRKKLTITFYSDEELQNLVRKLGGESE